MYINYYALYKFHCVFYLNSIGHQSCEIIMEEKTPLSHEVVCFRMLDFGTSQSNSEVSKSNQWKITLGFSIFRIYN